MAKAILAGYNIDASILNSLLTINNEILRQGTLKYRKTKVNSESVTPETLSAAYARISRSPKPVPELRRQAVDEVEKARKSNQSIIFELGHSSVAEHAVFNFDILHLSRLVVEFFERFRLASFTEKSQRYITLKGDYVTPNELINSKFSENYHSLIKEQNSTYKYLYKKLLPYFKNKYPEMAKTKRGHNTLDGWAKEDARYALALATETQLGMTVNARTLEHMISASQSHPLMEIQELGKQLFNLVKDIAPSIIKYPEPTSFNKDMEELYAVPANVNDQNTNNIPEFFSIRLLDEDSIKDSEVIKALGFSIDHQNYDENIDFSNYEKKLKNIFRQMKMWDTPPRAFEWLDLKFEIILSSSAFAQLKRHRMATIIAQPYDISLGATLPFSIKVIGEEKTLTKIIKQSEALYKEVKNESPIAAPYILTNAHRRRVLVKMNLRELYHFIRLRSDQHAQWDIRKIANEMMRIAKNKLPVTSLLLSGKDKFAEVLKKLE